MTFQERFSDNPDEGRFSVNSVRKFWEKRFQAIENSSNLMNAHLAQTALAQKTADMHYVRLEAEDRGKLMDLYDNDMNEEVEDDPVESSYTDSLESDEDGPAEPSDSCSQPTSSTRPKRAVVASFEVEIKPQQRTSPVVAPRHWEELVSNQRVTCERRAPETRRDHSRIQNCLQLNKQYETRKHSQCGKKH